jgi:hypothetical protein
MNFPIHMDDLGEFVALLRNEGFDARFDLFNGQVGIIVGPRGLDPKRMPPDTAALFFPLWELNYVPNRPLVASRKFHDVLEGRPSDWQFNRPYQRGGERERINLRHWNRSASLLGDGELEEGIQQDLIRRFPPNDYPVNIDVSGGHAQTYATVRITNVDARIDETEKAIPENFIDSGGTRTAVLDATERVIGELQRKGRVPAPVKRPKSPLGVPLSLRAIAYFGEGLNLTKNRQITQYEVVGLPPGEQAWIANFGAPYRHNWKTLRATGEVQSDWTGDYRSAAEALAVLQKELVE